MNLGGTMARSNGPTDATVRERAGQGRGTKWPWRQDLGVKNRRYPKRPRCRTREAIDSQTTD